MGKRRRSTLDKVLMLLAFFMMLGSGFLLTQDELFEPRKDYALLNELGAVRTISHDVRRKTRLDLAWHKSKTQDAVFEGDRFFTGNQSTVQIQLKSGTEITLSPNTLIVLHKVEQGIVLDLQYGEIEGKAQGQDKVILQSQGEAQELNLKAATFKAKQTSKKVDVQVSRGEVKVVKKDIILPKIKLLNPNPTDYLWVSRHESLSFAWQSNAPMHSFQIITSAHEDFRDPIHNLSTSESAATLLFDESLPYFWKVQGLDANGKVIAISDPRKLKISWNDPPKILTPEPGAQMLYNPDLQLSWEDTTPSESYDIELSKTDSFDSPLVRASIPYEAGNIQDHNVQVQDEGVYFWRVRGNHSSRPSSPWSPTSSFTLLPAQLASAELKNPSVVYKILEQDLVKVKPGDTSVLVQNMPAFEWSSVANSFGYKVEWSNSPDFKNPEFKYLTKETRHKINKVRPGPLYWRVSALDRARVSASTSATAQWSVQMQPPKLLTATRQENNELRTQWESLRLVQKYEIQYAEHPDFSQNETKQSNFNHDRTLREKDGAIYWRVRAVDENNFPVTEFSETQKYDWVIPKIEVPKVAAKMPEREPAAVKILPVALEPKNNTNVLAVSGSEAFIAFRWERLKGASSYNVEVSTEPGFEKPIKTFTTKGTQFVWDSQIPQSKLYWRVRGVFPKGHTYWSEVMTFQYTKK